MNLPKPSAFIFDWDNTLVDTWPVIHHALEHTFRNMGQEPWTLEQTKTRVRRSMRDSFPQLFGERWEEAAEIYQQAYRDSHLHMLKPLPGAEETLKILCQLVPFVAIVSNKKGINLRKEVTSLGWDQLAHVKIGADDAERDKPHPDPVALAFKDSGHAPGGEVWFVGDSEVDLECAKATGCFPVLYGPHEVEKDDRGCGHYFDHAFHLHVTDHRELQELLARIFRLS